MQSGSARTVVEPFFLSVDPGRRFCVFRAPASGTPCRGAFVHVPAFGEEMNKARRMTALQARGLAEQGIATVQIDLYGTGDSDGDFRDARWDIWMADVIAAAAWLERRAGCAVGLWGLRLGAMLAAQVLHDKLVQSGTFVLWQPVTNGELFLTQFLRLRVASSMLAGAGDNVDTRQLRAAFARGEALEIGGYELSPVLAKVLDSLRLADIPPGSAECAWLEMTATPTNEPSPASRKAITAWRESGVGVNVRTVVGEPFWSSVEIVESTALLDETATAFADLI